MAQMSTTLSILQAPQVIRESAEPLVVSKRDEKSSDARWDPQAFGREQVRGLVRQVFFPGWPRPARQVVISGIDPTREVAQICMRVAKDLAAQTAGNACLVDANLHSMELCRLLQTKEGELTSVENVPLKDDYKRVSEHLWFVSAASFFGNVPRLSAAHLRSRLSELRREFEYAVIHAPPAGLYNETALLGTLSDGVILVVRANSTRRIAARKTREILQNANARLLGTVLSERTFPIPEGLYCKL
jgi:protein-tyrosine kinase